MISNDFVYQMTSFKTVHEISRIFSTYSVSACNVVVNCPYYIWSHYNCRSVRSFHCNFLIYERQHIGSEIPDSADGFFPCVVKTDLEIGSHQPDWSMPPNQSLGHYSLSEWTSYRQISRSCGRTSIRLVNRGPADGQASHGITRASFRSSIYGWAMT